MYKQSSRIQRTNKRLRVVDLERAEETSMDQIKRLDRRLGEGIGAKRERSRLKSL